MPLSSQQTEISLHLYVGGTLLLGKLLRSVYLSEPKSSSGEASCHPKEMKI